MRELVENYVGRLIEGDSISAMPLPLSVAKPRIMPRIQPVSIFQHLDREQVAHIPFVNETVIVFVLDMPQMTVSITIEQMMRWGLQVDDLDRAVHVPVRDADDTDGYALPADLHDVPVRPGRPRAAGELDRDAVGGREFFEPVEHPGVDVRPADQDRAPAEPDVAHLLLVRPGRVGGVADVHGDADRRVDGVGGGDRPAAAAAAATSYQGLGRRAGDRDVRDGRTRHEALRAGHVRPEARVGRRGNRRPPGQAAT